MLLVMQRGVTQEAEGINAFYYEHGPRPDWTDELPWRVPYGDPGKVVRESVTVRGPGDIPSFLDIAAPDGTPFDDIAWCVNAVTVLLRDRAKLPLTIHAGPLMVRLQIEEPLRDRPLPELVREVEQLFEVGVALLPRRDGSSGAD